jgi:hypothetical protein
MMWRFARQRTLPEDIAPSGPRRANAIHANAELDLELTRGGKSMTRNLSLPMVIVAVGLSVLGGRAVSAEDKYSLQVPGGLAFAEFKGYEGWQTIAVSATEHTIEVILGNPVMIDAYQAGIPGNGKPFPDGAKMAKIHWTATKSEDAPAPTTVPGVLHDVDFMVKDSKRFADSYGWGYAVFEYDTASNAYRPGTEADAPPQANDAKCGAACHTLAAGKDYVFTVYGKR